MVSVRKADFFLAAIALAAAAAPRAAATAFVAPSRRTAKVVARGRTAPRASAPADDAPPPSDDGDGGGGDEERGVRSFLRENHPLFDALLLSKIPDVDATLRESDSAKGYTVFCPSNAVMEGLDAKRKVQISDPRNDEVTEKLASYHVVANGKVTQERLRREDWTVPKVDGRAALNIGGVVTLGGELRVGRSRSGGFLGWNAKEDGGVVIGNNDAKIVKSTNVGNGVVHEMDGFVAPELIWRYFDQLRIPGF